jgi:hypothetical protein
MTRNALANAEERATRVARLITAAGPVFLKEAAEREFYYQSTVRRRKRRDVEYRDPRTEIVEKARALATHVGRQSVVARALTQLSTHAFAFITDADTVSEDYEEKPGDRLRWGKEVKASERRADVLHRAAVNLVLAAAVRDLLTEAEFRLIWQPFEDALAFDALDPSSNARYGPRSHQVEAFIEMIERLGREDLRELFKDFRSGKDSYARAAYLINRAAAFRGLMDEVEEAQRAVRRAVDGSRVHGGNWNQSSWFARANNQDLERMHRFGRSDVRETSQRAAAALVVREALTKKDFDWLFWPYHRRFAWRD